MTRQIVGIVSIFLLICLIIFPKIYFLTFQDICPLQMQALAVIHKEFPTAPSGFKYYGDIHLYQTSHLPCLRNVLDIRYNRSLFNYTSDNNLNVIDLIMEENLKREGIHRF